MVLAKQNAALNHEYALTVNPNKYSKVKVWMKGNVAFQSQLSDLIRGQRAGSLFAFSLLQSDFPIEGERHTDRDRGKERVGQ